MIAVILAGGQGSRLRPLTCTVPKPMVPVCSRPVLEYIIKLLSGNGCEKAVLTLGYLGEKIEKYFPDGSFCGTELEFVYEDSPLGTAGGVRNALGKADDDFIVISGDAICDFDLKKAYAAHKKSFADATIIAKQVDDPREYGLITAENGMITGFCEKPSYTACVSDLANTGVYILSPSVLEIIPKNKPCDFARDVFPAMARKNMKLMCFEESGYWCDIGDINSYMKCHRDLLCGKARLNLPAGFTHNGAYISPDASVSSSSVISGNCVISDYACICSGAKITDSIIMRGAYVGENTTLNGCIVGENARLEHGAMTFEGAVIGDNCTIGRNAVICSGVKLWPNKHIDDGETVNKSIKIGEQHTAVYSGGSFSGETNAVISPELAAKIGGAVSVVSKYGIAVAADKTAVCKSIKSAFCAGVTASGKICHDIESGNIPAILNAAELCGCDIIVCINCKERTNIEVFARGGLPLTRVQERLIDGALNRGEYVTASWREFGNIVRITSAEPLYISMLRNRFDFSCGYKLSVSGAGSAVSRFAEKYGQGGTPLKIRLTNNGSKVEMHNENGCAADYTKLVMLCAEAEMNKGNDIALPYDFPSAADELSKKYGCRIHRYYASSNDDSDLTARRTAAKQRFLYDGLYLALNVLEYLTYEQISLQRALSELPEFAVSDKFIKINCPPQRILSRLNAKKEKEGVVMEREGGFIRATPSRLGNSIRLISESVSSETAKELCAEAETAIRRIISEYGAEKRLP